MQRANTRLATIGVEEILCVIILAFFAMQGAIPGIAPNEANEMTHAAATRLMIVAGIGSQLIVNAFICILSLRNFQRLRRFTFALQWAAPISVLAFCSALWSQDAITTARRGIPFILATIFALYFASRFSIREQLATLTVTLTLAAIVSALLAIFAPSIGLDASTGHAGNWQGVFTQKNACGRAMVFATAALLSGGRLNPARIAALFLFLFVLIMSGSRGAWFIEALLLCSCALVYLLHRCAPASRLFFLYVAVVVGITAAVAAWLYFPSMPALFGRDATLSGRTGIWQQVWFSIEKRPLLGYGFAAFWQGMKGESYNVNVALKFVAFHAHNGFLEIWLELGVVGLLLFALSYARACRKLWRIISTGDVSGAAWMTLMLLLIILYNLDENTLLTFNGLFWVLYVVAIADIEILAREHRLTRFATAGMVTI